MLYFASLRDAAGCAEETVASRARDPRALYGEVAARHGFKIATEHMRVSINGAFVAWDQPLSDGDEVIFIPPVSGG